jgi:thioredoxin
MAVITCPNCGAKNRVDEQRAASMRPVCGRCGKPLIVPGPGASGGANGAGKPIELTDATFDSALASAGDKPVLVDCWAAWCGPCRMIAPTIDQLASQSDGRWVVAKLDVDANPRTAARFDINAIPAMLIFKNGQLVEKIVGLQPRQALAAKLRAHASASTARASS